MADRDRYQPSKPATDKKKSPEIGHDVPDESKERHTEIAVEVGHKHGEHPDDKK